MASKSSLYKGRVPIYSFVLTFVKGNEISKLLAEGQPIGTIARHLGLNFQTLERVIKWLEVFESEIARGDVMAVGKVVWKGRLGWERSASFLQAKAYIEAGELMPRETKQRRRQRRRPESVAERGVTVEPSHMISTPTPVSNPAATPPSNPVEPSPAARVESGEVDDVLDGLKLSMPLIAQANRAAQRTP